MMNQIQQAAMALCTQKSVVTALGIIFLSMPEEQLPAFANKSAELISP
ncbi:MAG: hypothetical protein P4L53_14725 [Candidatus Obscuribacterales bacterium]|nr:hypothetical protein [Candidatus Obscuribacterales bacterium]